jgi:hypothetical protein
MAIRKFDRKGYGQIEPSQVWFTRAGMSESQCELDPDKFAAHFPALPDEVTAGKIYAEDGAFLMVDKERKIATIPTEAMSKLGFKMGINYSTEKLYNQYTPGRRNFCLIHGEALPRIGFIEPGMRICTNTVSWDDTVFTVDATSTVSPSVQMYNAVKARLAGMNDATTGRATAGYTGNNAPIYAVVTDDSQGELVIGADPDDAIGNVYAIVTEAYYNADNTLAFKLLFVEKPTE